MRTFIDKTARNDEGFVLVLALVMLLLLTLFGVWALNSSDFENRAAGHMQQAERIFNVNEGGNYAEGSKVMHSRRPWFVIKNPNDTYKVMMPDKEHFFGAEGVEKRGHTWDDANDLSSARLKAESDYWPWDNLENRHVNSDDESDYRYLVTYLYPDTANITTCPGQDASMRYGVTAYKFRVQAAAARQNALVETAAAVCAGSAE